MLAVGGLYAALPDALSVGPKWLVPLLVGLLSAHIVISHRVGHHAAHVVQGHLLAGILTAFMLWSLVLLVRALPAHKQPPVELLRSAAGLWITNVLIFALWYWRLDAGGPHQRFLRKEHTSGAFLFPQMTHDGRPKDKGVWSPRFIDYLFLAFNTSTALSPTDTPVLSRWAKALAMTQASISLTIVIILAARAVNML